ncbi:hypothetical protein H2508_04635 [Parahaliea sp. F7430]|uniref:Dehydrogenase n=1 Tax=Sediminihaliea albiluteola TaxID=2758564 RepID=A0A7W2TUV2_9GAMM|nr:PA2817 family protein [Sediminihaliea albiluteola]MBA6412392.1 hypothetical protein [Sediminihaliea albiluteola]
MNDQQYLQYCMQQWQTFADTFVQRTRSLDDQEPLRQLALACQAAGSDSASLYQEGPQLISRLFTLFPEFAPTVPRELLWFLGGECLHYMAEEEVLVYQQLDEARGEAAERGEVIDFEAARARLLK